MAVKKILHKDIFGEQEILRLSRMFRKMYDEFSGKVSIGKMKEIAITRINERAHQLRRAANGDKPNIKPLYELRDRSAELMTDLIATSRVLVASMAEARENAQQNGVILSGETCIGKRKREPRGIDAFGIDRIYEREQDQT